MAAQEPLIRLRGISKAFGAVQAVQGVDLDLYPAEVLGLVGDNAAGKSTLMKVLTGVHQPDEGEIRFEGRRVTFASPRDSRDLGIEMIYQNLALARNLDVVANVFLGREHTRPILGGVFRWLDEKRMEAESWEILRRLKINMDSVRKPVELFSGGQQQAVAIARAVSFNARAVIMDEPTASLAVKEVGKVLDLIAQLRAKGVSVIIISHRLQDIFAVGDRVMVLRGGQSVAVRRIVETTMDEVVKYIVGAEAGGLSAIASGR
ncbi:MAG: ABC transporter ATP-binding protein [candidate division NC10 bacterium RBG_16_65_8]|nr:MAG: ABC transporter ATP-binding protein [candidate division NC10 bacterium RBG_16_65_8]